VVSGLNNAEGEFVESFTSTSCCVVSLLAFDPIRIIPTMIAPSWIQPD
jgi:hypothetical protein